MTWHIDTLIYYCLLPPPYVPVCTQPRQILYLPCLFHTHKSNERILDISYIPCSTYRIIRQSEVKLVILIKGKSPTFELIQKMLPSFKKSLTSQLAGPFTEMSVSIGFKHRLDVVMGRFINIQFIKYLPTDRNGRKILSNKRSSLWDSQTRLDQKLHKVVALQALKNPIVLIGASSQKDVCEDQQPDIQGHHHSLTLLGSLVG